MSRGLELLFALPGAILPTAADIGADPTGWLFCDGRAISRTTYAALFSAIGTKFGVGDGSTTFNIPDLRGRTIAYRDDMGGSAANRLNVALTGDTTDAAATVTALSSTANLVVGMIVVGAGIPDGTTILTIDSASQVTLSANATATASGVSLRFGIVDGATLGSAGGAQVHTVTAGEMPKHNHRVYGSPSGGSAGSLALWQNNSAGLAGHNSVTDLAYYDVTEVDGVKIVEETGSGNAHQNIQPTIILNALIKT